MNFVKQYIPNEVNWKVVTFITIISLVACIACIAIISYLFLFYCKKTMDDYNIFFNDYNAQSQKIIDKYGEFPITRAYLITTPITNLTLFFLNLITMQNCKNVIDDVMHVRLLLEIKVGKCKKMILIDKTNCINILTEFHIDDMCTVRKIKIKNKTTLRGILDTTCERIGKIKFFNWHIYKNNCHYFIKNLILMINNDFNCTCFKSKKRTKNFCNKMFYNDFILHLYHVMMFLYNFFQKYIINVNHHVVSKMEQMFLRVMG